MIKIPLIIQVNDTESGSTSLAMILAYYRKSVPLIALRDACSVGRDGCTLEDVCSGALEYGLAGACCTCELEQLACLPTPCILAMDGQKYIVLEQVRRGTVYFCDPATGRKTMPVGELKGHYTGYALTLKKNPDFQPDAKKNEVFRFILQRLSLEPRWFFRYCLASTLLIALTLIMPMIQGNFTRLVFSGGAQITYTRYLYLYGVLFFGILLLHWWKVRISEKLLPLINMESSKDMVTSILNMPISFYKARYSSDLLTRVRTDDQLTKVIISQLCSILINLGMLVVCLAVMLRYSFALSVFIIIMLCICFVITLKTTEKRQELLQKFINNSSRRGNYLYSTYENLETINLFGASKACVRQYATLEAQCGESECAFFRLDNSIGLIPKMLSDFTSISIFIVGAMLLSTGYMDAGIIMTIHGIYSVINAPIVEMSTAGKELFSLRYNVQLLQEISCSLEKETPVEDIAPIEYKLNGDIQLKNVTFGYQRKKKPLFENLNLQISHGEHVAIVGQSGCGKTTLKGLLSGELHPWNGSVQYDGIPRERIANEIFIASVSMVDQNITIFDDSILQNIKLWDDSIEDFEAILAARDADLHEIVQTRPQGYETMLYKNGASLSGGQCQKIEIARALAAEPSILIMDEATNSLDALSEKAVMDRIYERGITIVVIAHRLSAIRDCDRIVVMGEGGILDIGRHEELMERCAYYRSLVTCM